MRIEGVVARAVAVVDRSLRRIFPADYDKRCMYAAFGLQSLLKRSGVLANIVGGDFLAFVVARSGDRAGMQGFGFGNDGPSHYWVETEELLLDFGPHYLPVSSSFDAAPMPFVAWRHSEPLPHVVRYKPTISYAPGAELLSTSEIMARMAEFIADCNRRYTAQMGQPKPPTWMLSDIDGLAAAAKFGDPWAQGSLLFLSRTKVEDLPF